MPDLYVLESWQHGSLSMRLVLTRDNRIQVRHYDSRANRGRGGWVACVTGGYMCEECVDTMPVPRHVIKSMSWWEAHNDA